MMRSISSLFIFLATSNATSADLVLRCEGARSYLVTVCTSKLKAKIATSAEVSMCIRNGNQTKDSIERLKVTGHEEIEILEAMTAEKDRFASQKGTLDDLGRLNLIVEEICGR